MRIFLFGGLVTLACSSTVSVVQGPSDSGTTSPDGASTGCTSSAECTDPAAPVCDPVKKQCVAGIEGSEIGRGDGTASSVDLVEIYKTKSTSDPIDLDFDPSNEGNLWVVGYADSSVYVGFEVTKGGTEWKRYLDPARLHFLYKPPALAMGAVIPMYSQTWGGCGDNDNGQNTGDGSGTDGTANFFMGPTLWTTDLTYFAKSTPAPTGGPLGSHLDMLHSTPFCRGIAHEKDNVYWVFNSHDKSIDKYDFHKDHGPGHDDHSDGEIYRYANGEMKGSTDGTPSHLYFDKSDNWVYVADTGNARIVRIDSTSGTTGKTLPRPNESLKARKYMDGATLEEIVPAGTLKSPAGLEVRGDLVYVTDAETSMFYVFKKNGEKVRSLETGLPPGSLAGFNFGPDKKIYFVDRKGGRVMRLDPKDAP